MARLTDRREPGTPPPPRSPFLPPEPRPQLPPAETRVRQRALAAVSLAVLSLLAMMLIGNLQRAAAVAAVALVVAAVAVVLAFSALSAAKQGRARRPGGARAGAVLGVIGLLWSAVALLGFLVFHAQLDQYNNCMNAAATATQQQACKSQLHNAIDSRVGAVGGS
jgi:multisubunit Na+/H+ antiporter MnhB subunit